MRVAVITSMTGDYDNLTNPEYQDEDFDYYFFTDGDSTLEGYTSVKTEQDYPRLDKLVKIQPYLFLNHDVFIWHDANMHQVASLKPLLASVDKPMAFLNHPSRNCVVEEIEAIAAFKRGNVEEVCRQVQEYLSEGMPPQFGLWECGVNIKFNTPEVREFTHEWFNNMDKGSYRDQLSFAYTMWKNPIDINWLHTSTYRGREFKLSPHKS